MRSEDPPQRGPADDLLWAGREERRGGGGEDRQHRPPPSRQTKLRGNINRNIFRLIKIFDKNLTGFYFQVDKNDPIKLEYCLKCW